ncbi:relaxase/mobilization nuclease domain-containing protein [Pseudomonas sp. LPH60]|uniref:relaxase/mobilization nuclease domain-containing protein n=1 Tax=Pseudomonas sp. LPH60 TaxID=3065906 RepID=UPI00273BD180|nr:relaxase/mobilization nuclease domain-containing protein [Pseudomonas sp. LPH60]MDP4573466.1 relaxase/mobilization nuclease domain-containing protein [Pseudomonas sp. LPH60]
MTRSLDGVLKDWGDRFDYGKVKGGKGRNARSGQTKQKTESVKNGGLATREKFERTVKKAPEVMVKISGGGKNMRQIKAHMDYISRNGEVEIEDENGQTYLGKEDVRDVRDAWAKGKIGIPDQGEERKEAFNIVLSMPPGTNRQAVKDAARSFAMSQFDSHQYIFAAHDDEKHPHVHLAVKAMSKDGVRLNPRKADLQQWRELFAEKLREQGIEANATPRKARGIVKKPEKQAIRQIERRGGESRVKVAQRELAEQESSGKLKYKNPATDKILDSRKDVLTAYSEVARALAASNVDDKRLALDVVQFIQQFPSTSTQHEMMVHNLKQQSKSKKPELFGEKKDRPGPGEQEKSR